MKVGTWSDGIIALIRRDTGELNLCPSAHMHQKAKEGCYLNPTILAP